MAEQPRVTAVILAYGDQPLLSRAVEAVLSSTDVRADVVLVDNGGAASQLDELRHHAQVTLLTPGSNLGFAAGCNLGAREATGEFVAFVNSDAIVSPDALALLIGALGAGDGDREVGLATPSVRLLDAPDTVNTVGNPVHFLGISWAGGLGRDARDFPENRPVASASGATTVARRQLFVDIGGFCETLFTYVEDTDLSLRMWLAGLSVVYVAEAVVLHDYEFSRNPDKFYLLERNRLFMVLTLFPTRLLAVVAPVLIGTEILMVAFAARHGWARQKLAGWWWLSRHLSVIRDRRRREAMKRVISSRDFAAILTSELNPGVPGLSVPGFAQRLLNAWWWVGRRLA